MVHATPCENFITSSLIRLGCAGWSLSAKHATEFPRQGSHLERYGQVFSSVEINSSFYRSHQPKTYARWAASVPDSFRFSVKIPRRISHELRLRDAEEVLNDFMQEVSLLGEKLGCLLLQLPPSLAFDKADAHKFFSLLRRLTNAWLVCEPRHATWFTKDAAETMKDAEVICASADPSPFPSIGPMVDLGMQYIRLHGSPEIYYSAYDAQFLQSLAMRIAKARNSNIETWCIFDNTAHGAAVPNALTLMNKLAKLWE
jgi:uncharacterized protein YecE (DUF72 family)